MKRLLFSLVAMLSLLGWTLHAQTTVTLDFNGEVTNPDGKPGSGNVIYQPINSFSIDGYAFSFESTGQSKTAYYKATTGTKNKKTIRMYAGSSMTIKAPNGVVMTGIEFVGSDGKNLTVTANEGSFTLTGNNGSWSGKTDILTISTNAKWFVYSLEVTYTGDGAVADPNAITFSEPTGSVFEKPAKIELTSGASPIHYTLDGIDPTAESPVYDATKGIEIIGPDAVTIKAIAGEITDDSKVYTATYTFKVPTVTFNPAPGTYQEVPFDVTLATADKAVIYYTTDGSDPKAEEAYKYNNAPIVVDQTTVVKAIALFAPSQYQAKNIVSGRYAIDVEGTEANFPFEDLLPSTSDNWTGLEIPDETEMKGAGLPVDELTSDGVTISFQNIAGAKQPDQKFRLFLVNKTQKIDLRIVKKSISDGASFTVKAPEGSQITSIVIKTVGGNFMNAFTASSGMLSYDNQNIWTGNAEEVTFTGQSYSGNTLQIASIQVICGQSLAPVFNWASGMYYAPFDLSMTTGLENGKIAYTTDGSDPVVSFKDNAWSIENGREYTSPVAVSGPKPVTVKAVAYAKRINPVTKKEEAYISEITVGNYTFQEVEEAPVDDLQLLIEWFTAPKAGDLKTSPNVTYPNINAVVRMPFGMRATAWSKTELYADDGFPEGVRTGVPVIRPNTDWAAFCEEGTEFNSDWIVSFKWVNDVTPALVLHSEPTHYSQYVEPLPVPAVTAGEVLASAEWNQDDIDQARLRNEWLEAEKKAGRQENSLYTPASDYAIRLLNPSLVSQLVEVKDVTFTASTLANKGNNPNASFTGKDAAGNKIKFVTRFPIESHPAGTYNVKGIVAYDVNITMKDNAPADTTVTVMVYPVAITAEQAGGEVTEAEFAVADEPSAGNWLIVAADMAFTPLAADDAYGYMPVQEVKATDGTVSANVEFALTFVPTPDDPAYFYLKDTYGRYIYQTEGDNGYRNNFNVSAELPEDTDAASWIFEPAEDAEGNAVWMITNAASGKFIQYDSHYKSYGCYDAEDYETNKAQRVLPVIYLATGDISGIEAVAPATPAGPTEVYNLQGVRVGSAVDGLPAGIYIVRRAGVAVKMIVR